MKWQVGCRKERRKDAQGHQAGLGGKTRSPVRIKATGPPRQAPGTECDPAGQKETLKKHKKNNGRVPSR